MDAIRAGRPVDLSSVEGRGREGRGREGRGGVRGGEGRLGVVVNAAAFVSKPIRVALIELTWPVLKNKQGCLDTTKQYTLH